MISNNFFQKLQNEYINEANSITFLYFLLQIVTWLHFVCVNCHDCNEIPKYRCRFWRQEGEEENKLYLKLSKLTERSKKETESAINVVLVKKNTN